MASVINKLSAILVSRLDKPGYYGDGGGLWLQVSPTKSKSWIFRYTIAGRQREMGLGSFNTVDLTTARAKARESRQMLLDGIDPLASRRDARAARAVEEAKRITFDQCAAAYIEAHRGTWKNAKHVLQWENTIATYASSGTSFPSGRSVGPFLNLASALLSRGRYSRAGQRSNA